MGQAGAGPDSCDLRREAETPSSTLTSNILRMIQVPVREEAGEVRVGRKMACPRCCPVRLAVASAVIGFQMSVQR